MLASWDTAGVPVMNSVLWINNKSSQPADRISVSLPATDQSDPFSHDRRII